MLPTCRVHCAIFDNDGSPVAGAVVTAKLDRFEVYQGYVVPDIETATTDETGACTLALWPNALGATASSYAVKIVAPNGRTQRLTVTVPNVADANLHEIANLPPYEGKPDGHLLIAVAVSASTSAQSASQSAGASATSAAGSAASAATSASAASSSAINAQSYATQAQALATTATDAAAAAQAAASAAEQSQLLAEDSRAAAALSSTSAQANANAAAASAAAAAVDAADASNARQAAETAANNAVAVVTGGTASLTPEAGKIPLADASGKIDAAWLRQATNDIGVPGQMGFGVGICPDEYLPAAYAQMSGTTIPGHDNYGNYQFSDGSVEVWIPQCWFKIGMGVEVNGLEANRVLVKPAHYFRSEADANDAGYMSHRADWDAGKLQPGVMVDKYPCSANNGVASSIKNAMPMVSGLAAGQVGFSAVGATNQYHGAIVAAKTRSANHFPASRFIVAKLALLSLAHGQAATAATHCAWYDAAGVINFPKGCNNNALKDVNDTSVTFTSAGASTYPAMPLAGSGVPFAKTTHNGQVCGVADMNGTVWEINLGITCIASAKSITAATQASPVALTVSAHGFETGDFVMITGVGGMTQLNDKLYKITVVDANTITLDGCNGTAFGAYASGGTATMGRWYASKKAARMAGYTSGTTLATDHWGATGVAATMDRVIPAFRTDYPNNGFAQRFGNGANQVLSGALSGNDWTLSGLGFPVAGGMSSAGSNAFGLDYCYQYVRNELCVLSGAYWSYASVAGVWAANLGRHRTHALHDTGIRAASYLVS